MLYYAVPEIGSAEYTYTFVHTPQFFSKYYDYVQYKTRNT